MEVKAERIETHKLVMEIVVPQPEVAKAINKACQKIANQVTIPGFRKGKATRKVLEMRVGKQAILDEAFEIMASEAYGKALVEQNAEPVTRPEVDIITLAEDQPLTFKVSVIVKPDVQLGEYKGLAVEKVVEEVTEEMVDKEVEALRNRHAQMVVVEDAMVENGDFATIDFDGYIDGEAFEGGSGQGYPLNIGSGSFIPGFEDQLVGAKTGDEVTVKVCFPADYHAEKLAGKDAEFKVKIHEVKRRESVALDDDFAKDVSEFETLAALRDDLKAKLVKSAEDKAENDFRNAAIEMAVNNTTVELPEVMVEQRIASIIDNLKTNLESRGMDFDSYLKYTNSDVSKLKEQYRDTAHSNVKTDLMLDAIAKQENIVPEPMDIQMEIVSMAQSFGANPKDVWDVIQKEDRIHSLQETIVRKKAARFIIENVAKAEGAVEAAEAAEPVTDTANE